MRHDQAIAQCRLPEDLRRPARRRGLVRRLERLAMSRERVSSATTTVPVELIEKSIEGLAATPRHAALPYGRAR